MALTPAEKQRRYRARLKERLKAEGKHIVVHYRQPKGPRGLGKRWRLHVAALVEIQEQVRASQRRPPLRNKNSLSIRPQLRPSLPVWSKFPPWARRLAAMPSRPS